MNYFVKRVLLFIPSLLLVSIVVFMLTKLSPGTPLLNQFSFEELSYQQEQEKIEGLRKHYQLDLPLFYFSIYRGSSSDTLNRITNATTRDNLKALAYEIGDWSLVNEYYKIIKRELNQAPDQDKSAAISKIFNLNRIKDVEKFINSNKLIFNNYNKIYSTIGLMKSTNKHPYANLIFKSSWNGINNQYHHWLINLFQGDFGTSYIDELPVSSKIFQALKWTLLLSLLSIVLAYLLAVPAAIYAALHENSFADRLFSTTFFAFYALPTFWVGTLCIVFLTNDTYVALFPTYGVGEITANDGFFQQIYIRASHLFLPVFIWTYGAFAYIYRQLRKSLLQQKNTAYYQTALAKGLSPKNAVLKHALKNAALPMITLFGNLLPLLISGSFVIEYLFSIPGMGKLTLDSFLSRDYPVIYGVLLMAATLTLLGNMMADLMYQWVDPRINISSENEN